MTTGGYIEWASGETLNAEDAMRYLMQQSVTIWATTAARQLDTDYVASITKGNLCFIQADNEGTGALYYYNGTAWKSIASQDYVNTASATIEDVFVMLYMETI